MSTGSWTQNFSGLNWYCSTTWPTWTIPRLSNYVFIFYLCSLRSKLQFILLSYLKWQTTCYCQVIWGNCASWMMTRQLNWQSNWQFKQIATCMIHLHYTLIISGKKCKIYSLRYTHHKWELLHFQIKLVHFSSSNVHNK